MATPELAIEVRRRLHELVGWLGTWSGAAAHRRAEGRAPTVEIVEALARLG